MTSQGWDQATARCRHCGHIFTATTEEEFLTFDDAHRDACRFLRALAASPQLLAYVKQLLT